MQKQNRTSLYIADRDAGMKYRDIAAKYGVSYQAVAQVCARNGKGAVARFRPYTAEEVIYPNLRQWLNENKVSRSEFMRRLGKVQSGKERSYISHWFRGHHSPTKKVIDNMLAVTGLTYEQLFATEREEG
jgi:hypothetical protein